MNETGLWQYLRRGMEYTGWHPVRIESSAGNGVPDVSFGLESCNGWIELKYIKEWPKRPTTLVELPLRKEQAYFFKKRGMLSGNVWCLIRIENHFFLLTYSRALTLCMGANKETWLSLPHWEGRINFPELHKLLSQGC